MDIIVDVDLERADLVGFVISVIASKGEFDDVRRLVS